MNISLILGQALTTPRLTYASTVAQHNQFLLAKHNS